MKKHVAFICLGNSCRSIMAEALARHFHGGTLAPASAGLQPLGYITRETLQVLAELGVSTAGLRSKGLEELDLKTCGLLVNLTDFVVERLLPAFCGPAVLRRPIPDPYGCDLEVYRQTRDDILHLLNQEVPRWLRDFPDKEGKRRA